MSLRLQPVVEEVLSGHDEFQRLQGDVLVALGLVVAVDLLQLLVEQACKQLSVGWRNGKLDDPLVSALGVAVHEHRCCRVLTHLGPRLVAGVGQALLGIVDDELFAKGVDKVLRTSGDDEFVGVYRRELYGVANHISPQSARRRDDHGVVLARFDGPKGDCCLSVELLELIEHVVVNHEEHRLVLRVVLYAEESLTGIVGLLVVHAWRCDEVLVLLAVGSKGHASVEEHFEVGPHLFQMLLSRELHDPLQDGEHPRWHSRQVGDVLRHGLACYAVALDFEVAQQSRLLAGCAHDVHQRVDVLDENGTQVAHQRSRQVVVRCVATAEDESLTVEESATGIVAQVDGHGVGSSTVVNALQSFRRDGYEL